MLTELVWVLPFAVLLGSIALLPLTSKHWWERHYPLVSFGLAGVVVFRYLFQLHDVSSLLHTGLEYASFIVLIGALYVVAGGIHINVKGEATPWVNTVFLFVAALLANLLGTTGASMVFVRPWIRMNKYRITAYHVAFFIFLVSNVGGALTPIADPPLFLGYLRGVPFFWVLEHIWPIWLLAVLSILAVFFVWDTVNFKKAPPDVRRKETAHEEWKFLGTHNALYLAAILGAVFINDPPFLREAVMLLAAVLSYKTTPKSVHESNDFNFGPIKEVAILFAGIFATMIPALQWLERHATEIGIHSPGQFYWGTGVLSSVLDNAPTYLNFLSAALGLFGSGDHSGREAVRALLVEHSKYVTAISVGAVFFGAMTYIGNGPNFLVKSIAERSKVKTPSFFGYVFRFSLPVLLPVFFLVWVLFFRV